MFNENLNRILFITFFLLIGIADVAFAVATIPEPATAALCGLGLLCIAGISRKKIKQPNYAENNHQ